MKKELYFNIWSEHNIGDSVLKAVKSKPRKIFVLAAEEYEVNRIWTKEFKNKFKRKFINNNIKLNFIFGAAELDFYNNRYCFPEDNIKVSIWPTFFLYHTLAHIKLSNVIDDEQSYSDVFVSMNGSPHRHRCLFYDCMSKYNLDLHGKISWNPLKKTENYEWKYRTDTTPKFLSDNFQDTGNQFQLPAEWNTSFLNLVSETSTEIIFITEKTWLPILYKKPFLVQSKNGFYETFQKMGFVLYDEIFDYSFDSEVDTEIRTEMILKNVKNLVGQDLNELYKKILPKITYNFNHAIKIVREKSMIPKIVLKNEYVKYKYSNVIRIAIDKVGKY
jgi:hypothetical protein